MTLKELTCSVTQEVVGPTNAKQSLVKCIKLCSYLIQPVRLSISSTKHLSMHWLCCFKQGKRIGLQAKASGQISQKLHKSQSHKVRQNEVHSVINFRIFLAQKTKKKKSQTFIFNTAFWKARMLAKIWKDTWGLEDGNEYGNEGKIHISCSKYKEWGLRVLVYNQLDMSQELCSGDQEGQWLLGLCEELEWQ